ncbi:hypothetical protein KVT40_004035 [Elsinoe batatas]|uniref:non-specific serine/threonine protein kinase n=1 Tax=Elsinoe batatas TaxID=2601811 RepID=A0A8K0L307_9PEZI|nr:hypothetical protein KVT40_004035 [Elsinoe batatas]
MPTKTAPPICVDPKLLDIRTPESIAARHISKEKSSKNRSNDPPSPTESTSDAETVASGPIHRSKSQGRTDLSPDVAADLEKDDRCHIIPNDEDRRTVLKRTHPDVICDRGDVFIAKLKHGGQSMVAKYVFGDEAADTLKKERSILARVKHENIIRAFASPNPDLVGGSILLEYFDNSRDLSSYSDEYHFCNLSKAQSMRVLKGIPGAILALWKQHITHADIKPENILITRHGPKLIDFGASLICNEKRECYIGTAPYAAPETIRHPDLLPNPGSWDIWAFGVTMLIVMRIICFRMMSHPSQGTLLKTTKRRRPSGKNGRKSCRRSGHIFRKAAMQ